MTISATSASRLYVWKVGCGNSTFSADLVSILPAFLTVKHHPVVVMVVV